MKVAFTNLTFDLLLNFQFFHITHSVINNTVQKELNKSPKVETSTSRPQFVRNYRH